MTTAVDPRIAILSDLCHPEWNPVSESFGMSHDDAVKLLDAYGAAVLLEAAEALERKFGITAATVELRLMSVKTQQPGGPRKTSEAEG